MQVREYKKGKVFTKGKRNGKSNSHIRIYKVKSIQSIARRRRETVEGNDHVKFDVFS